VIVDVPPATLANGVDAVVRAAHILMDEGNASAVKVDGDEELVTLVETLAALGIPVVAGVKAIAPGDWDAVTVARFVAEAHAVEAAGAFALVVVGIPPDVGETLSRAVQVPVIGAGAGHTDGQIVVWHWLFNLHAGGEPRFSKRYEDLRPLIDNALARLSADVADGAFPGPDQQYQRTASAPT
jgi:3-methyl-2-oxobutanoate hydroxymethyltransferase